MDKDRSSVLGTRRYRQRKMVIAPQITQSDLPDTPWRCTSSQLSLTTTQPSSNLKALGLAPISDELWVADAVIESIGIDAAPVNRSIRSLEFLQELVVVVQYVAPLFRRHSL
jgi:hypothetical protein